MHCEIKNRFILKYPDPNNCYASVCRCLGQPAFLTNQTFFSFECKTVFSDFFRWDAAGGKRGFVMFFLYLGMGFFNGFLKILFLSGPVDFKFNDVGVIFFKVKGGEQHIVTPETAFPV